MYFVMRNVNNRLWLYREFRDLVAGTGSAEAQVTAAINEMLAGRSLDPDYTSPWPSGSSVRSVQFSGDVVTVDLAGAATNNVSAETANMAVQQLVYTATGAADVAGKKAVERVRLLLDGQSVATLWGYIDTSGVLSRAPRQATLGLVWLESPQEGETVGRTFQVRVLGIVSGGVRGPLQDRELDWSDNRGATAHAGRGSTRPGPDRRDGNAPGSGSYTLEAFFYSLSDSSIQAKDDHRITVS